MKKVALLLLLILAVFLYGCGGPPVGCGAIYAESPNSTYEGSFTGSYNSESGSGLDLELQLSIGTDGNLTGTVTESVSNRTASASGKAFDFVNGCDKGTGIVVEFTFSGEEMRSLSGRRAQSWAQPWKFNTTYSQGNVVGQHGSGTVSLTRN